MNDQADTEVTDQRFAKWALLAAGKKVDIADGEILCGFFEHRVTMGGKALRAPVSIYPDPEDTENKRLLACVGTEAKNQFVEPSFIAKAVYGRPLTHERWLRAYEGRGWWDEVAAAPPTSRVATTVENSRSVQEGFVPFVDTTTPASAGHNRPPPAPGDEKLEEVAAELDTLEELADGLGLATAAQWPADRADQAGNLKNQITTLEKKREAHYKIEVAPKDEAVAKVRGRWNPLRDRLTVLTERIKAGLGAYMTAEKERRYAEAKAAIAAGKPIEEVAPQKVSVGGAAGRKVVMRKQPVGKITDFAKFAVFYSEQPGGKDWLQKAADGYARQDLKGEKDGGIIPGYHIEFVEKPV